MGRGGGEWKGRKGEKGRGKGRGEEKSLREVPYFRLTLLATLNT